MRALYGRQQLVRVIHADLEKWLVGWLRAEIRARPEPFCQGVEVDRREPSEGDFPARLVVVRSDGGNTESVITAERGIGISVLAGTLENPSEAIDLALMVHALMGGCAAVIPGNPIVALRSTNGPYAVVENQPRARQYMNFSVVVVGREL